jgi:hypothetical protein
MRLEKIITLASPAVRLQFVVMERSLRATGCDLPLWVIPYDDQRFELPDGATWWVEPETLSWIDATASHASMRKYQCLTTGGYQFADADIVFLRDPTRVLAPYDGVVTACTEWNKPRWTYTAASRSYMAGRTSTWQRSVVNSGQFACDRALYDLDGLKAVARNPALADTCFRFPVHEQPGINLLLFDSLVPVTNLTLPPFSMQSTWAGDYPGDYLQLWRDEVRKPYLIHWAGRTLTQGTPIDELFYQYLTQAELAEWLADTEAHRMATRKDGSWPFWGRALNRVLRRTRSPLTVAWRANGER